ncbi:MAG: 50S ribosomal protein L5 [Deltaproteobacteria bacterium]|nr:50S ribosomal protein L5 [Deltaproteobacteria bacterium]
MLETFYKKEVVPKLKAELGRDNIMTIPRLSKITVNTCLAEAVQNVKVLEAAAGELAQITGQKASIRRAKKAISAFKLRAGLPIGAMVTLRKKRMYEFFNRLVNVALPRTRDFKGLSRKGFDGRGNYTMGVTEQIIFPEISHERSEKTWGMNVTIVTTAKNDAEGEKLLRALGFPLRNN